MHHLSRVLLLAAGLAMGVAACGDSEKSKAEHLKQGDAYIEQGKLGEALVEYQSAVRLDNMDGQARLKLGRLFARMGDRGRALEHLVRAADLLTSDAEAQLDAARALLGAGRFEDAGSRAERVIKTDPKNVQAHILRASATAGLRDASAAIQTLEAAIALDPTRSVAYLDLATLQAATGKHAEAEAGFKQAVVVDPKSVPARLALSNYYWIMRRGKEAEQVLRDAAAMAPNDASVNQSLANLYRVTGRTPQAEAPLKSVAAVSDDPRYKLQLADYYIGEKRPEDAKAILQELTTNAGASDAARARLAAIQYESGERDAAYRMIDELIAEKSSNAQIQVVKGGWLLSERKLGDALKVAQAAVKTDPKSSDAHFLLGSVLRQQNENEAAAKAFAEVLQLQPNAFAARIALAQLNVTLGQPKAALDLAREAAQAAPTSGDAHYTLARALLANGAVDEAQRELLPVLKAAPNSAEVHALYGRIQQRKGDAAGARASFARSLELDAAQLEPLIGLVNLDLGQKRRDDATRRVEAALAKDPNNPRIMLIAGRTYAATADLARSEAVLRQAIETDPTLLEAYHVLGQIFVRQKKLGEALAAYEDRIKTRPDDVSAHTMVGMILYTQGKAAEAKARFERVLSIEPRAAVAANNLAFLDAEAGTNLDIALDRAQIAKTALPDDPDVNDTLGWVYVKRNLPSLAIPALQQAVQKTPTNPIYHYHLGMAHLKAGNQAEARNALNRALTLAPKFDGADEARKALATLPS
jgi:tetratricopeptide (TPR) repeat protein